jgi:PTS system nitrogen regulatory IIA component
MVANDSRAMGIADLIEPDRVIVGVRSPDKPQLLKELAGRAAALLSLDAQLVLDLLAAREALGSTGVGEGVAVPHARISGLATPFGLFARLKRPIDYESVDERPVDLVFLLLTPATVGTDHLAALAAVSRRLRDRRTTEKLQSARSDRELYDALTGAP